MRDTQKNIKQYKEQLKFIKEKMVTTLLMFLVACTMMTTTSFAWITLSKSPEVKGITTSVAGNGNLEIALASSSEDGTAKIPEPSQAGDSQKDLLLKNITWGNLINLNDDRYGLNSIVLRPATLNRADILKSPLLAVEYARDGRVLRKSFDFSYANYDNKENKFVIGNTNQYGVRAISSVQTEVSGQAAIEALNIYNNLNQKLENSKSAYRDIVTDSSSEPAEKRYLSVISGLMGVFLTDKLNDTDTNIDSYTATIYNMVYDFTEAMRLLGEVYVEMANIQILKFNLTISPFTLTTLMNESEATLKAKSIPLMSGWDTFKNNYLRLTKVEEGFYDEETKTILDPKKGGILQHATVYKNMTGVKMSQLQSDVDFLVNINTCVIDDKFTIAQMGSMGMGDLAGMLSGTHKGTIVGGALKDYEQLTGEKMDARNMTISAKYGSIPASVKANIATNATAPFTVPTMIEGDGTGNDGDKSILGLLFKELDMISTAGDVYGMSIDFWVRTNMNDTYLVLEGEPVIEYQPLYTNNGYIVYENATTGEKYYHIPAEDYPAPSEPNVTSVLVPSSEATCLMYGEIYSYSTNQEIVFEITDEEGNVSEDTDARQSFISELKYSQKSIVVGYDGVNRVWQESTQLVDGTSTTQGKGSCFIFYPDDPIEQDRMLKLLNAFTVAFIDSNGNVLTTARLNSDKAYEESGKIIVPLELSIADSTIIFDDEGNEIPTIMPLDKNADIFISAVVYLDGELIENQDVSDAKNINGYLNLQFGSTDTLVPQEDEELQQEYIVVNASVDQTEFTAEQLPATTNLTVDITGVDAKEVKVNFVRQVNNFQGVKMDTLVLNQSTSSEKASTWTGAQVLENPGTYILRNVWVDGVEYELTEEVRVEIPGLTISSVSWDEEENEVYKMSSDNYYDVEVSANINASEILTPTKVEGLFKNEYNEYVTIPMSNTGSSWVGEGRFTSSGTYTLEFLRIDGELYYVEESMQKIIHLSLGIYAKVDLSKTQFDWSPTNSEDNVVTITGVEIFDNKGTPIQNLSNSTIHYSLAGNVTKTLSSLLEWHEGSETYRGQFKVVNPGIYEFNKISISTADSTSEIRVADAPRITAISPFSPELIKGSLVMDDYQFAPNKDANFSIKIDNSSSATVVAKVLNVEENKYYYVEAPVDKASTQAKENTDGESTTTWYFYPKAADGMQDGTWVFEELYITNVYYGGTFHSMGEGEWWLDEEGNGSFVTFALSDIINEGQNTTTHILTQIYVTASNSGHTNTFSGVFTQSLANNYYVNNFQIVYKDKYNVILTKEELAKYGLSITGNTLNYTFGADYSVFNDKGDGWWTNSIATSTVQSEIPIINFSGKETIYFRYPGTYTPVMNITMERKNGSTTEIITSEVNDTKVYHGFLNVTFDIKEETVSWDRPYVKFVEVSPASGVAFAARNGRTSLGSSTGDVSNSMTDYTLDVYHQYTTGGLFADAVPSQAKTQLYNGGAYKSATCQIVNSGNGDNNSSYTAPNVVFTFSPTTNQSSFMNIGSTRSNYSSRKSIGKNSLATTVSIVVHDNETDKDVTYTIKLEHNLVVNGNNGGGY